MVWDPSPFCENRGGIQMKQKFPHNSKTNQANGTKFGMLKFLKTRNVSVMVWDPSPLWNEGPSYKWNTSFYIARKLIRQMEPYLACEGFWRQEMFLLWFETPPSSGRGILIQMKHKFLHNSRANQANGTKLGMWKFLRTKNVSVMVWDPSSIWKKGPSYKWNTNFS